MNSFGNPVSFSASDDMEMAPCCAVGPTSTTPDATCTQSSPSQSLSAKEGGAVAAWSAWSVRVMTGVGCAVLVVGFMLFVIKNCSLVVAIILINGGGFALLGYLFYTLKEREEQIKTQFALDRKKKGAYEERRKAAAPHALPEGYQPPAGWKPGDGCPAMLPDHWFTNDRFDTSNLVHRRPNSPSCASPASPRSDSGTEP